MMNLASYSGAFTLEEPQKAPCFRTGYDKESGNPLTNIARSLSVWHPDQHGREWRVDYARLASDWREGDREAGNVLFSALSSELRAIAAARLRQERNCSLSIGDLVNEAMVKLFRLNLIEFRSRAHILALTSRLMRQILVDEARKRNAARHNHESVTLNTNVAEWEMPVDLMTIDMLLKDLHLIDPERSQIVEMRFFGGMSSEDIAEVLGLSEATVKRRWAATRAWLRHRLRHP
ncbi:MAG: hypothetical protein B7X90_01125 [Novosphingobium sp. 17-62-19]|nr:MAG: hypothetical protein B7X90_01125 [Novosphingobium sp. 17-62-19]HQS95279.1 ECF-type sigma factor [Novosphingobium sp.]